jgi:hypothetical protein
MSRFAPRVLRRHSDTCHSETVGVAAAGSYYRSGYLAEINTFKAPANSNCNFSAESRNNHLLAKSSGSTVLRGPAKIQSFRIKRRGEQR